MPPVDEDKQIFDFVLVEIMKYLFELLVSLMKCDVG